MCDPRRCDLPRGARLCFPLYTAGWRAFYREIGDNEGVVEGVAAFEVVDRIRLRFPEDADVDQIENHLPEVLAAVNAPELQDGGHHRTELLERVLADAFEELLAGNVTGRFPGALAQLQRVVEAFAQEMVGVGVVTGVVSEDEFDSFTEFKFLHSASTNAGATGSIALARPRLPLQIALSPARRSALQNLRADSMHLLQYRQPPLRVSALLLIIAHVLMAKEAEPGAAARAVEALRAQAAALSVGAAGEDDWAKIARHFAELVARYPDDPGVRSAHAEFLWDRDDRPGAIREWEIAERLAPRDAIVLARLAEAHLALGQTRQCAQYFRKASDVAPNDARLRHATGNAIFLFRHQLTGATANESQIVAEALDHLAASARLAPNDVEYARSYAETFYAVPSPDWHAALAAWERYRSVSPDQDFAHANLARVRLHMGHYDAALAELEKMQHAKYQSLKAKLRSQIEAAIQAVPQRKPPNRENLESRH